jgi:hypothetical protein
MPSCDADARKSMYGTKEEYTKGEQHTNGTEPRPRAATWIGL